MLPFQSLILSPERPFKAKIYLEHYIYIYTNHLIFGELNLQPVNPSNYSANDSRMTVQATPFPGQFTSNVGKF